MPPNSPFYRILLTTLYGTGERRAEVAHLKFGDIDKRIGVRPCRGKPILV
jgi:site-specific recombinase XerD